MASLLSDNPAAQDNLGIQAEVDALAKLIASLSLEPPLTIGLFGTNGQGRTFFANNLYERVLELSLSASQVENYERPFCQDVVQIRFNAWINSGAEPQLAITQVILSALAEAKRGPSTDGDAGISVFYKLPTAKRLRGEIHSRLTRSNEVLANAQENVEKARRAYSDAMEELATTSTRSKWSDVAESFRRALADPDEAHETIDSAGEALGFTELFDKPEALVGLLDQAKTIGGRAGILTSSIKVKRYIGNIALILLGMLLLTLGVFLAYQFLFDTNDVKKVLDGLGKFLTLTSTATAVTATWLAAWGHNQATRAISELDRYDTALRDAIRNVDIGRNASLDICKAKVSQCSEELIDARRALAEAQADVARVTSELRQFDEGDIVLAVCDYYRGHGVASDMKNQAIVPMVREDLGALSRTRFDPFDAVSGRNREGLPDRIVLYIDDLDQCIPHFVVEVLTAVNLLLGFPLFVVVIVADPLRLLNAISFQYGELIGASETGKTNKRVSSLEYLTKLVHIPFWLRPLDASARSAIVRSLSPLPPDADSVPMQEVVAPTVSPTDGDLEPEEEVEADPTQSELLSRFHGLSPRELETIEAYAGVLETPQKIKRLVNLYLVHSWIILGISRGEFRTRSTEDYDLDCEAVVVLLVILLGAPEAAPNVFQLLNRISAGNYPIGTYSIESLIHELEHAVILDSDRTLIKTTLACYRDRTSDDMVGRLVLWSASVRRHSFNVSS